MNNRPNVKTVQAVDGKSEKIQILQENDLQKIIGGDVRRNNVRLIRQYLKWK